MSALDVSQVNRVLSQVFQGGQLLERVAAYWKPKTTDLKAFRASTPNAIIAELEGKARVSGESWRGGPAQTDPYARFPSTQKPHDKTDFKARQFY